jgi:hypothetical protein
VRFFIARCTELKLASALVLCLKIQRMLVSPFGRRKQVRHCIIDVASHSTHDYVQLLLPFAVAKMVFLFMAVVLSYATTSPNRGEIKKQVLLNDLRESRHAV